MLNSSGQVVPLTDEMRAQVVAATSKLSEAALRCLGFARIDNAKALSQYNFSKPEEFVKYESGMTFLGVVGMFDPPRPEVKPAVQLCRSAGIRVIVITGDNKVTLLFSLLFPPPSPFTF
jgi:P-type Ca2+ transporter type 2A